jgi:hypothetical protein
MKKISIIVFFTVISFGAFAAGHTVNIVSQTNATCFGVSNGSATASVTGGTGPFTYNWSPVGGTTATVTGLSVGTYTVTVTDQSDASTATATVTIAQPPQLVCSVMGNTTLCPGQCTQLNAVTSGGTPGYTYSWAPASGLNTTTGNSVTACPFATSTYTVTVSDGSGCVTNSVVTLFVSNFMTLTMSSTNSMCGQCNGTASGTVTGGSAPYTYQWSQGVTMPQAQNLCAGTYSLTVIDATGCSQVGVTAVNSVSGITDIYTSATNATCGNADGVASADSIAGGTAPYTYLWTPGAMTTPTITGLTAGTYTVVVTDSGGCTFYESVIINNLGGPTAVSVTTVSSSCTSNTGQINITGVTGGVSPYTYSLDGGAFAASTSYSALSATNHSLVVRDVNGCIYNTSVLISLNNPPVISLDTLIHAGCSGLASGSISIIVTGGSGSYTYNWSNGSITQNLTNLAAGNYTVIVTDMGGCSATHAYYIPNNTSIYANVIATQPHCGTFGNIVVVPAGGTPSYTFLWNTTPAQTTSTASNLSSGYYSCLITDANGCSATVYAGLYSSCYNIIKGNIYNDANSNCIKDAGENGLTGRVVTATPGGYCGYTDANGNYTIATPNMNNTVTVSTYGTSSYLTPTCPASGSMTVNFTNIGDTINNNNFGYYADPNYLNLVIHPGWSSANPGFSKHYWICYYNASPAPQNVLIRFVYDSVLQYTSCTQGGVHYPAQHKIEWTFNAVPFSTIWDWYTKPEIYFNVPSTLSTSSNLHSYFEILPITGDVYPADNTLSSTEPVTGSHDPNSKSVMPKGDGVNGNILATDSILLYTIHFQNNGNDTAHFVVVKDTLSQYLDAATIVPGASNHPYTFDLSDQGVMTFTFDNIMLPDSAADEPGSNGYFNYTIRQKANNPAGTVITNSAAIYFDYNLPVITNTTVNTIVDVTTDIVTSSTNNAVKVYPNPFSESATFVIQSEKNNETYSFQMVDVLGKTVCAKNNISEKQFTISKNGLQSGMYFYNITNSEGVVGKGKVIIK